MENQKKPNLVSNIWSNWCNLPVEQRARVAERLGPIGHALSIAANVHQFASQNAQTAPSSAPKERGTTTEDDDNVIDAEFEDAT